MSSAQAVADAIVEKCKQVQADTLDRNKEDIDRLYRGLDYAKYVQLTGETRELPDLSTSSDGLSTLSQRIKIIVNSYETNKSRRSEEERKKIEATAFYRDGSRLADKALETVNAYNKCFEDADSSPEMQDFVDEQIEQAAKAKLLARGQRLLPEERQRAAKAAKKAVNDLAKSQATASKDAKRISSEIVESLPSYKQAILYKEQCVLTNSVLEIVQGHARTSSARDGANKNLLMLDNQDPSTFMNLMTVYPSQQYFANSLTTIERSTLMPRIELFKVFSTDDGEKEVKIPFESSTNYNSFITNRGQRAAGIGLKSFSIKLNGNNPFAVKKSISARLEIVAASFSELSRERTTKGQTFRFIDLALKTGKLPNASSENDILNFRLKAVVGWRRPNKQNHFHSSGLRNALNTSFMTLNLTPTNHEFSFSENGSGKVVFSIDYLSFIDEFYEQPKFNIFIDEKATEKYEEYNKAINQEKKKKCGASDPVKQKANEEIDKLTKEFEEEALRIKTDQLSNIQRELLRRNKIYVLPLTKQELRETLANGSIPTSAYEKGITTSGSAGSTSTAAAAASAILSGSTGITTTPNNRIQNTIIDSTDENIMFFYIRDLFDVIFDKINLNIHNTDRVKQYLQKFKLILGPIEINPKQAGQPSQIINIGEVPVSFKSFVSWMSTKILSIDKHDYPFIAFARAFLNEYLVTYFNDKSCYKRGDKTQSISMVQNFVTSYNDLYADLANATGSFGIYDQIASIKQDKLPLIKLSGFPDDPRPESGFAKEQHYLSFHAGRTLPKEKTNGNKAEDAKRGIYHFKTGRNAGIVHTISLQRTNAKGLPEVRFESSGYDGLLQFIDVYDVTIKADGFFNVFPGNYIYVDPKGFDPSEGSIDLTRLGIGGYCMVTDIQHSIIPKCVTTITARWQAPKEGTDLLTINDQSICESATVTSGSKAP